MKNLIPIGILFLCLYSCSVEHSIKRFSPREIGSYEISSQFITYKKDGK